uniref:hypothetical protein n=1 Tax=Cephaloticoccus sp. TaxID=1985742 RepID=UPI0040492A81
LMWFWDAHYTFFRRYGLEDGWTRFLNIVVLLLVVFLAYPLKFLFGSAFATLFKLGEAATGIDSMAQLSNIYIVYGVGLGAVWFGYFLLYWHAYRKREALRLTTAEVILTRGSLATMLITMCVCLISIGLAAQQRYEWQPGMVYSIFGPALGFNGWWHGSRARKAEAAFQQRRNSESGPHQIR